MKIEDKCHSLHRTHIKIALILHVSDTMLLPTVNISEIFFTVKTRAHVQITSSRHSHVNEGYHA